MSKFKKTLPGLMLMAGIAISPALAMANPVVLVAPDGTTAQFKKNATQKQRITMEKGGEIHICDLPCSPIRLSPGRWQVRHETLLNGKWVFGRARVRADLRGASFDDNPGGGDNDFNDAIVFFSVK